MSSVLLDMPRGYHDLAPIHAAATPCTVEVNLAVQLPFDHTHATDRADQAILTADLPAVLALQLRDLDQGHAEAMSAFILAAFIVLLARYSGEYVMQLSARSFQGHPDSAEALPARPATLEVDLADAPPFVVAAQRVRDVLDRLSSGAAPAPAPLEAHTVGFSYQRLADEYAPIISDQTAFLTGDLRLEIVVTQRDIQAIWIYQTQLFETATIARMHEHFQTLLAGIVANPAQSISQLPLLTEAEHVQMLVEWNDTATPYQDTQRIHDLFEQQVRAQPNAPALTFEAVTLTYHELNTRANQLAHYLRRIGVGSEILVGICVERSIDMIVGMLGVLKAGGAYVPLDPTYPIERLTFMLADTQMPVILTHKTINSDRWLRGTASASAEITHAPTVVCLDSEWERIAEESALDLSSHTTPDNLAYVIYTSGSTGRPKGTLLTHRGLCNLVMAQQQMFDMRPGQRVLQFASCSFDASAWELVMALCTGATLCLAARQVLASIPDLLSLLRDQAITTATLPPSLLALLPPEGLPNLTTVIAAGEACTPNLIARWAPGRRFFNAYGPTETTVCATWYLCAANEQHTPPIGRPLPNVQTYILDRAGQPVPIGVPGELHIGGVSLARGYLNRPDLTAERFIAWKPNVGTGAEAAASTIRLYKTGDLTRYRADGMIEFLGRIDHQVKLRGFRIELGEIEATLRWHPAVQDAIVLVREETPGLQRLVAYMVMNEQEMGPSAVNTHISPSLDLQRQLRIYLREKLPDYMVPSAFVPVKTLPLTPNGKVDRRALPAPEDITLPMAARRTPEETLLAGIWASVLGRPHVGIHDDFFALGGHSLLAAQAISLIRSAFSRDITLQMLYEAPSIAAFACTLGQGANAPALIPAEDLRKEIVLDRAITVPASPHQSPSTQIAHIFLTGATGFLGTFLLNELLTRTNATIYCLVRDTDSAAAGRRLQQTLAEYHMWRAHWRSRIIPVLGDLRDPLFGLSTQEFGALASQIDVIYHAGGQVHYLYPYAALKATNVHGTVEIIRLACQERLKPIHYISTISAAATRRAGAYIYENDDLADCNDPTGYGQSKWVSEGILRLARERGVPVAIYRPGRIGSHSLTGIANPNDFFVRLLASCIQIGLAPDVPMVENLIPVDYTARAIVHLSRQARSANQTFHLLNPQSISWPRVISETQALGYPIQMAPYQIWYNALVEAAAIDPSHALHTLLPFLPQGALAEDWIAHLERHASAGKWSIPVSTAAATYIDQLTEQEFDTQNTIVGLSNSGIRCPVISALLLKRFLADGTRRRLFAVNASVTHSIAAADPILCES